jgi:hypothetical protein
MIDLMKIDDVTPLDGSWLRITFSDGAIKEVDIGELIESGGVFAPIAADRSVFERVRVNPETRTIEWPGSVDLDADVLYGTFEPASGAHIPRRSIRSGRSPAASRDR